MIKLLKIVLTFLLLCSAQLITADEQAVISPLAHKSLLLASSKYGPLTVVVGERGHILYSHDTKNWAQASVDTKATLTSVIMLDEKNGWAVGHDAVILKTDDGARIWHKVFSDVDEQAPLLDIYFRDALNGMAIGAYGLMYLTHDGGVNWQKTDLKLLYKNKDVDSEFQDEFTETEDLHLNAISYAGDHRFYIAAEAGRIFRSDDDGQSWLDLSSPYRGSFFGVLPLSYKCVLVYGLRGHLYHSSNAGDSWIKIETGTEEMLTDAKILSNGDIVVVGLAGTMILSKDNGNSFLKVDLHHRHGLSEILEITDRSLLFTGDAGIQLLSRDSLTSGQ